jgi:glycosyltransferase involved in cell wall biosynthesis
MKEKLKELSVFFPAYNESAHIGETVHKAFVVLPKVADKYEVIVIDDGSRDETGKILKKLTTQYSKLRVITHKPNKGYGEALKSGFYNCKYELIAFTDSDGQFNFSEITKFIVKQRKTGADLVVGYYLKRAVSFRRKLNTWLWQLIVRILFGLNVRDIDCGFKLIKKQVIDQIPRLKSGRGAFISSEFLIKAQKLGFKIVEVGVNHYPRIAGQGTGANIDVIINSFVDLFKLWVKLR